MSSADISQKRKRKEEEENENSKEITQNQKEFFSSSSVSETEENEPPQKKKRKRVCLNRNLEDGVILHFTNTPKNLINVIQKQFNEERIIQGFPEGTVDVYDAERVILKPSKEEKEEYKRKYREEYTKANIEKIRQYQNSEKVQKRREEYNNRPDVQENKRKRAAKRRKLLREFKNKDPEFYDKFMNEM